MHDSAPRHHRWRPYHALALLPTLGMLGGLSFANRVYPLIFGLPFLMAWLVGWVVATSAIMALVLRMDRKYEGKGKGAECGTGKGAESGKGKRDGE